MKRLLAVVFLLAFAVCIANAAPITLQYKFKAGDVSKYKMSMDMKMLMPGASGSSSMNMKMTADMTQKVLSVNKDGSARVQTTISNTKLTMPGGGTQTAPTQVVTMVIAKDGKVIKTEGKNAAGGISGPGMDPLSVSGIVLPKKPVNVGEKWQGSLPMPGSVSGMKVVSQLLSASALIDGKAARKVKQDFSGKMDLSKLPNSKGMNGTMNFSGTVVSHIAAGDCKLLRSSGSLKAVSKMKVPASAQQKGASTSIDMTTNMTMTITKVK